MKDKKPPFCCYCGKEIIYPLIETKEHIIPLSKGGNNNLLNKTECCKTCNSFRGNLDLSEFKKLIQLGIRRKKFYKNYSIEDYKIIEENIDYLIEYVKIHKDSLTKKGESIVQIQKKIKIPSIESYLKENIKDIENEDKFHAIIYFCTTYIDCIYSSKIRLKEWSRVRNKAIPIEGVIL